MSSVSLIPLLIGLILGVLLALLFLVPRLANQRRLLESVDSLVEEKRKLHEQHIRLEEQNRKIPSLEAQTAQHQAQIIELEKDLVRSQSELMAERRRLEEQKNILTQAEAQFSNLAHRIFEERSGLFATQNQEGLGQILQPFKQGLEEFRVRLDAIHYQDAQQQALLHKELENLKKTNLNMSEEAHRLSTALHGQAKTQGQWGELVLENVLEQSGLEKGRDYSREPSFNAEEGRRRPDVVVRLPEGQHLIIDAKVSLTAYSRFVNSEDSALREAAIRDHLKSLHAHLENLSSKNYFDLSELNSPPIVFMFVPIESAFAEAVRADPQLLQMAQRLHIQVATPSTLLTSLTLAKHLWQLDQQSKNGAAIHEAAGKMHKKFVDFLASMDSIGKNLDQARDAFEKASRRLHSGPANLVKQAHELEKLGVVVQKPIPENLVERALLPLPNEMELS